VVIDGSDLTKAAFDKKIGEFARALGGADAGAFFYAGHGLQVNGQNCLVPVDAQLTTASALDLEMVRVDVVQRIMESETQTNILFLDACRDNPLARNLARALGTRSSQIGRGLAVIESGAGGGGSHWPPISHARAYSSHSRALSQVSAEFQHGFKTRAVRWMVH
jgi:hypothetical protein